ncbi:hypothetical protein EON71_00120 [bacterium]|nr:MAG: hypothetical protein EON71_00120 [bacterium]
MNIDENIENVFYVTISRPIIIPEFRNSEYYTLEMQEKDRLQLYRQYYKNIVDSFAKKNRKISENIEIAQSHDAMAVKMIVKNSKTYTAIKWKVIY